MRYRLRTLMILLTLAPPLLAGVWFALPYLPVVAALAAMAVIPTGMLWLWVEVL